MCASSSRISPKNSLRNTTLHKQPKMAGSILRFSAVAMAYRNQADSPMTSCAPAFRRRDIVRPPQHLVSGAISGVPSNFFYLLTTSESNMREKNTPSISSRLLSKTTRSPQTGKEQNLQKSTLLGIIITGMPIGPAAYPRMDTLQKVFSNMDTPAPRNRNSHCTNTLR